MVTPSSRPHWVQSKTPSQKIKLKICLSHSSQVSKYMSYTIVQVVESDVRGNRVEGLMVSEEECKCKQSPCSLQWKVPLKGNRQKTVRHIDCSRKETTTKAPRLECLLDGKVATIACKRVEQGGTRTREGTQEDVTLRTWLYQFFGLVCVFWQKSNVLSFPTSSLLRTSSTEWFTDLLTHHTLYPQ